jgi:Fic family protein
MEKDILEVQRNHLHNILKELNHTALDSIMEAFKVVYTYDAISLEGQNRIPFEDVKKLIQRKTLLEYSEREQKEVLNHLKAFDKIINMLAHKESMNEDVLKDIHEMIVDGIFQGGVYRNVNIQMMGSTHQPTDHAKVYDRMHKLFSSLETTQFDSPLDQAIYIHATLAKIHPFLDGNGRLARLVLNYHFMKADYLPVSIPIRLKETYIEALEVFKIDKNITPLKTFFETLLIQRYEDVINALEISR